MSDIVEMGWGLIHALESAAYFMRQEDKPALAELFIGASTTLQSQAAEIARLRGESADERQAAIVRALRKDAHRCDCFAYEEGECTCGAWGSDPEERSFKRKYVEDVADWIESGEWRK